MLGLVEVPKATTSADPVQVFSPGSGAWEAFPTRLMTARERYRGADDWLPGVLEGHSLAFINCNNDTQLTALRPYVALRGIADDSASEPSAAYDGTSGDRLISSWVSTGAWPAGRPSTVTSLADAADPTARVAAATQWLSAVREYVAAQYLTDGGGVGALAARRLKVPDVMALERAPMFMEIADIVYEVLAEIEASVEKASTTAGSSEGESSHVARPEF